MTIVDRITLPFATARTDKPWYGMNENTDMLKWIAMITMVIDHAGAIFFPYDYWIRMIGRVSFPLFCWCLVVGADHTRNIGKYGLRLLGLLVVSQPFFMLALRHEWWDLNIFATLFLGLAGIASIQRRKYWVLLLVLPLSLFWPMDYGMRGVICILVMYALRKSPYSFAAGFTLYCAAWGLGRQSVSSPEWLITILRYWGQQGSYVASLFGGMVRMQMLAVAALPLILLPLRDRWRLPGADRWLYWVYPAHLAVLYLIKLVVR